MKTLKLRLSIAMAMAMFLSFAISSCSKKVTFQNSSVVPAAEGSIKISKNKNDNSQIDIKIIRLADPSKLSPPQKLYIVWMETSDNGVKNLGQLNSSSGLFSSTLKAEMHTSTPFKPTKVFITAEDSANTSFPGTTVVLTTNSF